MWVPGSFTVHHSVKSSYDTWCRPLTAESFLSSLSLFFSLKSMLQHDLFRRTRVLFGQNKIFHTFLWGTWRNKRLAYCSLIIFSQIRHGWSLWPYYSQKTCLLFLNFVNSSLDFNDAQRDFTNNNHYSQRFTHRLILKGNIWVNQSGPQI